MIEILIYIYIGMPKRTRSKDFIIILLFVIVYIYIWYNIMYSIPHGIARIEFTFILLKIIFILLFKSRDYKFNLFFVLRHIHTYNILERIRFPISVMWKVLIRIMNIYIYNIHLCMNICWCVYRRTWWNLCFFIG